MVNRERLSRRDALALALPVIVWGGLAYYERKPLGSLVKSILTPPPENSTDYLAEIESYIKVEGRGDWIPTLNKGAFATALTLIAQRQNPINGLEKLRRFLYAAPLTINLADENVVDIDPSSGEITRRGGRYEGLFSNGPTIIYYPTTVEGYREAQFDNNMPQLLEYDRVLLHEMGHLWQEIRDIPGHYLTLLVTGTVRKAEALTSLPLYDHDSHAPEIEAERIAKEVISANLTNTWESELPWPFGKFFEFPA